MLAVGSSQIFLYFLFYSVVGWLGESAWCSLRRVRLVNRGFLAGPWCPVYGFGALAVLTAAEPLKAHPAAVLAVAAVTAAAVEYVAGWLLETLFHSRWWDYSGRQFNLRGRVCLANTVVFGALGLAAVYVVQPLAASSVGLLHVVTQQVAAGLALALMALDLGLTLMSMAGLHERLEKARAWFDEVEAGGAVALDRADLAGSAARLRAAGEGAAGADLEPALRRAGALQQRYGQGLRLMRAFPALQLRETESEFEALRRAWTAQPPAGAKALVRRFGGRLAKARTEVAAAYCGVTATLLIWIFLIGNVTGYVVETVYCLIRNGHLESRQGLLYGPFSPVYGFGAVLMVLVLAPLVAKGNLWLFGGGAVIGGAFEVVCSLLQEALFGSVSWQYAGQPFALFGGRTGLVYMFLWGLLGLGYMRVIHPRIVHLVERLPGRPRRFFTVMIAVVLTADMLLSAAAVARWGERGAGLPPDNQADRLLDRYYPDEAMEQVYPNMEFLDG